MTSGEYGSYSSPGALRPGGLLKRFFARVIDGVLVTIVSSLGIVAIFSPSHLSDILVTGLFTGLLMFVYFVAFEAGVGWTPGKKLLSLEVRGPGGAPKPNLSQSAIRNSWTLFPIVPFVGGLLAFVAIVVIAVTISGSPTKQGKHDDLAGGTEVVDA